MRVSDWFQSFRRALFRKPLENAIPTDPGLKKVLTRADIIAYGVSSTVGAGIFVTTGVVAKETAGPSIIFSFLFAALTSVFSAFCYAEFSTRVTTSGSAYSFTYVSLGEFLAWFVGWNLTLEYTIGAAAIARGWSGYVHTFFSTLDVEIPKWLYDDQLGDSVFSISFLSVVIIAFCVLIQLLGVKDSAIFNNVVTFLNILIILFVIIAGSSYVSTENWSNFFPNGFEGSLRGAGTVFFSYIGFDAVTTLGAEVADPQKDLPIGIIGTLGIATALYILVGLVITGMVPYYAINIDAPLSDAFTQNGAKWGSVIIGLGSITMLTACTLCSLLGQPRIFFQMSKDGLLPKPFSRVDPAKGTPVVSTIVCGILAAIVAFFFQIDDLANAVSVGTLLAFNVVCAGVLVHRYECKQYPYRIPLLVFMFVLFAFLFGLSMEITVIPFYVTMILALVLMILFTVLVLHVENTIHSPLVFKCPLVPLVPTLGILCNSYLIALLPVSALYRLLIWTAIGLVIYFGYGIRHSLLSFSEHMVLQDEQYLKGYQKDETKEDSPKEGTDPLHT